MPDATVSVGTRHTNQPLCTRTINTTTRSVPDNGQVIIFNTIRETRDILADFGRNDRNNYNTQ